MKNLRLPDKKIAMNTKKYVVDLEKRRIRRDVYDAKLESNPR